MTSDPHKDLADAIDRAMKALPEVPAPATLAVRVLEVIALQRLETKRARGWASWPVAARALSIGGLFVLFVAACFGVWSGVHAAPSAWLALQNVKGISDIVAFIESLKVIAGAIFTAVKSLGLPLLLGWFGGLSALVAMLAGLGTLYVRLGLTGKPLLCKQS